MRTLAALAVLTAAAQAVAAPTMTLAVDAREAPRRLLHVRQTVPVKAGQLALVYPKWMPGEHGPTGPIADYAGPVIRAGGKVLQWVRDPVEVYRIRVEVPQGVTELELTADVLSPPPAQGGFSSGASMTQNLALVSWNQVVLYPDGASPRELQVAPQITVPQGWRIGTSLQPQGAAQEGTTHFAPTSLELLIDSPVLAGAHLVDVPLGENHGAPVTLHIAAETEEETHLSPEQKQWLTQLVREEAAMFGARHFDSYHYLLSLSDSVTHFGLEHHQSSDNRLAGRTLLDKELAFADLVHLLAHESVHSWNAKYRRPAGLATPDYLTPMKGELLWIYEGLTNYLGSILTARSGQWNAQALRDYFAGVVQQQRTHVGRRWRPLQDTATNAQILYPAREDWTSIRRAVDFYQEGDLFWLEVDARIREATQGKASLDDFLQRFHGGQNTGPRVVPYAVEDVAKAIREVAPQVDLIALWRERFSVPTQDAPTQGLERAGWRVDYTDEPSELHKALEKTEKQIVVTASIGLVVKAEDGAIADVVPGMPADKAGAAPAMKIIAVNGRKFSPERFVTAIAETKNTGKLELLVENAETYRTLQLDYKGGARYPTLVRIEGRPDLLTAIGSPHAK